MEELSRIAADAAVGDALAAAALDRFCLSLGAVSGDIALAQGAQAVVIGGGLGLRLGEPFVAAVREAMLPHLFVPDRPPAMLLAELGDLGGAVGACLLAETAQASR